MKFKKKIAGLLLAAVAFNTGAHDILVYKHAHFGEWKKGARDVNDKIATFVDPENPTVTEINELKVAQNPKDSNLITVGAISPSAQNVTPGQALSLSLPITLNGNTDTIKTTWSSTGGDFSLPYTINTTPATNWTAPVKSGGFVVTAVAQEPDTGTVIRTVTYTVTGGEATPPTFTLSSPLVTPSNSVTITGNQDSTDPDGDALTYKILIKNSAGVVVLENSTSDWTLNPQAEGLTYGSYTVIYEVTDGTYTTQSPPQNFTYGAA